MTPTEIAKAAAASTIVVSSDLDHLVKRAAERLGADPEVYKRAGELVRVVRIDGAQPDEGSPVIRSMPAATLKTLLTRGVHWVNDKGKDVTPPDDVVAAVAQLGEWPSVRRLAGVVEAPAMRPDGSILQAPGYDAPTGFVFDSCGVSFPAIPEAPTLAEAQQALRDLSEPFRDFPFASPAAKSVVIAAVLSLLGRPAILRNVPAFVVEASTRGTGKTLIADVCSVIATGRLVSKVTFPRGEDELEKLLGSYARKGAAVFSFDNVGTDNPFGGAPLDKVLTSGGKVDLRILGKSEVPSFDWRACIFATGNNVAFKGDTTRRVLVCRLESPLENPEDRADFAHPDLLEWVMRERARLVVAGLTILRGYVVAGRPEVGVAQWGSFEPWSSLIPRAIVWAGGVDPQLARPTLDDSAEPEKSVLERLLAAFPKGAWRARELAEGREGVLVDAELREVLEEIAPLADKGRPETIGKAMRGWKGRVVGGRRLVTRMDGKAKIAIWSVERV